MLKMTKIKKYLKKEIKKIDKNMLFFHTDYT